MIPPPTGHLLGPQGALERLRQLQERIEIFAPSTPAPTLGPATFGEALTGAIGGHAPMDPNGLEITGITQFGDLAAAAAQKYGLDENIFKNLVATESNWNPGSVSKKGAIGLTQLMPDTAAGLGVSNPYDPVQNLDGGARYLKQMLDQFGGDYSKALAAYNAGPGAVQRANGVPQYHETLSYVRKILGGGRP